MAFEVVMPRLGWTMEEGTLVEWLKASGKSVQTGEILFTVESDKALNEVESFDSGVLHIPGNSPAPGETVPVGTVLAYVLVGDEEPPAAVPPVPAVAASADTVDSAAAATGAGTLFLVLDGAHGEDHGRGCTSRRRECGAG